MGYFLTAEPETAAPANSLATPKTHTPLSRVEERGRRFYSPQVGRWLSRDPLEEYAFHELSKTRLDPVKARYGLGLPTAYLYVFSRNSSIQNVDVLGLSDVASSGCCGPDVTRALSRTLDEVQTAFGNNFGDSWWSPSRAAACTRLLIVPWALSAWDIIPLRDLGFGGLFPFNPPATQGTGDCKLTVAYNRKCYNANAVNFMLFGKAASLCRARFGSLVPPMFPGQPLERALGPWTLLQTEAYVAAWKIGGVLIGYHTLDLVSAVQAMDLTQAAYLGGSPFGVESCSQCKIDPANQVTETVLRWSWYHSVNPLAGLDPAE